MSTTKPPLNVLVIEDEAVLVMDLEFIIEDAGHRVVGDVASVGELEKWEPKELPDLALIDVQLAADTSGLDASEIVKQRWAKAGIVFVTANPLKIPVGFAGSYGVIPKPFSRQSMISALAYLTEGICDPPPKGEAPSGFVEFPEFQRSWSSEKDC